MAMINALGFGLRGGSATAKFLFVIYLAGKASPSLLGEIAILMAINAVFTQIAGLEINQVIGRQLHALSASDRTQFLQRHAFAAVLAYLVLTPAILLLYTDLLASHWISVCVILILDHFITEVYRFNILMLRPVYASGLLFIKNAGWVICFVALVETGQAEASLPLVLHCWLASLALTSAPLLFTRHSWPTLRQFLGSPAWVRPTASLVWQARPFIVSAITVAGIGSLDKLLIGGKFTAADLGIYFFFATCASIITLVVSFSVGATVGPQCIKIHSTQGKSAYLPKYRRLKRLYLLTAIATALAIVLPAGLLLPLLGKAAYQEHIEILYILVPSTALVVLCEPYKIDAYLERRDLSLVLGNVFHLLALLVCISLFALKNDIVWVSLGVLLSSLLAFVFFSQDLATRMIGSRRQRPA